MFFMFFISNLMFLSSMIINDLVVVELFDVEYYCDLEMWVRGH